MKWNIVTDSGCDLYHLKSKKDEIHFASIPFTINIGDREYVDDMNLNVNEMVKAMIDCKEISKTACPSPWMWYEQFEKADYVIAVTLSSQLSGSYNSANIARDMILEEYPDKKVAVIDSRSAGSEISLIVMNMCKLIENGHDFDDVVKTMEKEMQRFHIIFALSSFDNLIKNGRIGKITGFLAGKMGFWGIGTGSEQGTIAMKEKVRGSKKVVNTILQDIKERGKNMETVLISHCDNEKFATNLKNAIHEEWPKLNIEIMSTRGLCSYYAEKGGVIVAF